MVTHDESIFHRFDRLIGMRDGRIEGEEVPARHRCPVGVLAKP